MIQANFQHFYLNKNVGQSGNGFSLETPFKAFSDYTSHANRVSLTDQVVLTISDADFYDNIDADTMTTGDEDFWLDAPFATFGNVDLTYSDNSVNQNLHIVAGYVKGNIQLTQNCTFVCHGAIGVTDSGAPDPDGGDASTTVTFDNNANLGRIFFFANKFNGDISFSSVSTRTGQVHMNIGNWLDNNTTTNDKLNAMLDTLPVHGSSNRIQLSGFIDGFDLARLAVPTFNYVSGLPTRLATIDGIVTSTPITITLTCSNIENIGSVENVRLVRSALAADGTLTEEESSDVDAGTVTVGMDNISFQVQFQASDLTAITTATNGSLSVVVDFTLRYHNGQRDMPLNGIELTTIEVPAA